MDDTIKEAVLALVHRSRYTDWSPSEVADLAKAALDLAQVGRVLIAAEAEASPKADTRQMGFVSNLPRETP